MAFFRKSPTASQARPNRSGALHRALIWLLYLGFGGVGLWRMVFPGPKPLPALLHFMALLLVSAPMIVVHELGHYLAARLLGFTVLEFSVGVGDVVWKASIGNLRIVLRQVPVCGHVMHLARSGGSRWARIALLAAGPLANLAAAGAFLLVGNVHWAAYWKHPTLLGACVVVNLWHGLFNLVPFSITSRTSSGQDSDGWQILRLLLGKPSVLTLNEIESARKPPTGLTHLRKQASRSRRNLVGLLLFSAVMLSVPLFFLEPKSAERRIPSHFPIQLLALPLVPLAGAILSWRLPWTSFAGRREKTEANPLIREMSLYLQTISAETARLRSMDLPEDFQIKVARSSLQPIPPAELDAVIALYPGNLFLPLLKFDSLLHERRFAEAVRTLEPILARDDLAPRLARHLHSFRLATRLLSPENDGVAEECARALEEAAEDGPRMQRLMTFASVLLGAGRPELLDLAEAWLNQAQDIFPFDPSVHIVLGRLMLIRKNGEAAERWFHQAAEETAGTEEAGVVRAWQAIAAAAAGRPKARAQLRRCLKQDLPFSLRQRVESLLAAGEEPEAEE